MPQVDRSHLDALIAHQIHILRGGSYRHDDPLRSETLGPLATLVVDDAGWRRDGTALTRRLLRGLILKWVKNESDDPPPVNRAGRSERIRRSGIVTPAREARIASPELIATLLRRLWGVDEPPLLSVAAIARDLGVKPGTARTWPGRILDATLEDASRMLHELAPDPATKPRPTVEGSLADWRGTAARWPPLGTDPEDDGDRARLFERIAKAAPGIDDPLPVLRRHVARRLRRDYLRDPASDLVRDVIHGVLNVWSEFDDLLFDASPGATATHGRLPRSVIATVQMFCFDATFDDVECASELSEMAAQRKSGARFVSLVEARTRRAHLDRVTRELRDLVVEELRIEGRHAAHRVEADRVLELLFRSSPLGANSALEVSNYIRGRPVAEKRRLLEIYVKRREEFADADYIFRSENSRPRSQLAYALADQGADLEILNVHDNLLARRMAAVIRANAGSSYSLFSLRNQSLSASKSGEHARAVEIVESVYTTAKSFIAQGIIADPIEQLETMHQIALAATGILTATVEARIAVRRIPSDPALSSYVGALLSWSSLLRDYLGELVRYHGALPNARHGDGRHIYWRDWAFTTGQNRLRALIVARTAKEAIPGISLPRGEAFDVSLDAVLETYRELVVTPELSVGNEGVLVMQATWIAFLNEGRLPAVRSGISAVLATMELLDGPPSEMWGDHPDIDFRHRKSARWHIERGDGGRLAAIHPDSLAGAYLVRVGGQAYVDWRAALVAAGLTPLDPTTIPSST